MFNSILFSIKFAKSNIQIQREFLRVELFLLTALAFISFCAHKLQDFLDCSSASFSLQIHPLSDFHAKPLCGEQVLHPRGWILRRVHLPRQRRKIHKMQIKAAMAGCVVRREDPFAGARRVAASLTGYKGALACVPALGAAHPSRPPRVAHPGSIVGDRHFDKSAPLCARQLGPARYAALCQVGIADTHTLCLFTHTWTRRAHIPKTIHANSSRFGKRVTCKSDWAQGVSTWWRNALENNADIALATRPPKTKGLTKCPFCCRERKSDRIKRTVYISR